MTNEQKLKLICSAMVDEGCSNTNEGSYSFTSEDIKKLGFTEKDIELVGKNISIFEDILSNKEQVSSVDITWEDNEKEVDLTFYLSYCGIEDEDNCTEESQNNEHQEVTLSLAVQNMLYGIKMADMKACRENALLDLELREKYRPLIMTQVNEIKKTVRALEQLGVSIYKYGNHEIPFNSTGYCFLYVRGDEFIIHDEHHHYKTDIKNEAEIERLTTGPWMKKFYLFLINTIMPDLQNFVEQTINKYDEQTKARVAAVKKERGDY